MKKIILVLFLMLVGISVVGAQEYSYWIEQLPEFPSINGLILTHEPLLIFLLLFYVSIH